MNGRALSSVAALCLAGSAVADYLGVEVNHVSGEFLSDRPDSQGFSLSNAVVFELYAKFSDAADTLFNVFDVTITGDSDPYFETDTQPFYHALNSEGQPQAIPLTKGEYDALGSEVDTFVTFGFDYGGKEGNPRNFQNPVMLGPDFSGRDFIEGNSFESDTGWSGNPPNSIAAKAGTYPDNKILLARFAFVRPPDQLVFCPSVEGSLRLTIKLAGGLVIQPPAQEFSGSAILTCQYPCPPDLNTDAIVDGADLGILLAAWGEVGHGAPTDLNGDAFVDGADLGLLLAAWGPC
jgi:hypothetical protein